MPPGECGRVSAGGQATCPAGTPRRRGRCAETLDFLVAGWYTRLESRNGSPRTPREGPCSHPHLFFATHSAPTLLSPCAASSTCRGQGSCRTSCTPPCATTPP